MTRGRIPDKQRCESIHAVTGRRCSKKVGHYAPGTPRHSRHANEKSGHEIDWTDEEATIGLVV